MRGHSPSHNNSRNRRNRSVIHPTPPPSYPSQPEQNSHRLHFLLGAYYLDTSSLDVTSWTQCHNNNVRFRRTVICFERWDKQKIKEKGGLILRKGLRSLYERKSFTFTKFLNSHFLWITIKLISLISFK